MAKRAKQAAAAVVDDATGTLTAPQLPDTSPPQRPELVQPQPPESPQLRAEQPAAEQPARQWRANPYPVKTVNLGGYKVQLQESRPEKEVPGAENDPSQPQKKARWEMQIKFGSGAQEEMPSNAVRDYMKSHRLDVVNRAGEDKQVQLFKWNDKDRAWGMEIDYNKPRESPRKPMRSSTTWSRWSQRSAASAGHGDARRVRTGQPGSKRPVQPWNAPASLSLPKSLTTLPEPSQGH